MLEFDVFFDCYGKEVIINATKNMNFADLALKFMDEFGIITDDQPTFIYNSYRIPMDCCKSLDELKIRMSSRIYVVIRRDCYFIPNEKDNLEKANEILKKMINDLQNELFEKEINNRKLLKKIKELENNKKTTGNVSSLNEKIINLYDELKIKDQKIEKLEKALKRYPIELSENEKLMSIIINSSDQKIQHSIICKNTDKFIKIEAILYKEYPEYEELSNYFLSNGKKISKFKTLEENKIKNSDIITLFLVDE